MTAEIVRAPHERAALANVRPVAQGGDRHALQPRNFDDLLRFAETVAKTSFAPSSKPEEVFAMVASGRELGLTAMQSLKAFHMIQGKPSMSADGMVAVVRASGLCERWDVMESTAQRAVIVTRRKGAGRDVEKVWTIEDARRAQLTTPMWSKYPAQMLRHRCAADLARQEYSDVLLGVYTPDEVSDGVEYESADAPRRAPVAAIPAHVAAEAADAPQGSRAWAAYHDAIGGCATLAAVRERYIGLLADLREEGYDAAGFTEDSDGAPGAATLAARQVAALGHHLSSAERQLLLGVGGEDFARWADAAAAAIDRNALGDPTRSAAAWWIAHKSEIARPVAAPVYMTMARRLANDGSDPQQVKAAKAALTAEVTRQTPPPPPTGTDAPALDGAPANGNGGGAEAPAQDGAAAASRERVASKGGVVAYLASKGSRREVENAVRAHGRHVEGFVAAAVERLDALTPSDDEGTRVAASTLRKMVEAWSAEGPAKAPMKAAQRERDRAA